MNEQIALLASLKGELWQTQKWGDFEGSFVMPNEVALESGICALLKEKGLPVARHRFVFLKTLYEWTSTSTHFSILLILDFFL